MGQTMDIEVKGLHTHPNPFKVPQGALLTAINAVIDRENVLENRRGFKLYGALSTMKKMFNYQDRLLAHHGTSMAYDSNNAGTFVDLSGSYTPPTGAVRIRSVEAQKNFYFTTNAGLKKMDSYSATPGSAGMPKGLDGTGVTSGIAGFMATDQQVAYRILWGKVDTNNNKIIGAPSQRIVVTNNSGGNRTVDVTFTIPSGITTSHFYQIYRSGQSGGVAIEPNDELQMIVEKSPTAGEITAISVTYTDQTPDNLRGANLYTNPGEEGILEANDSPPIAQDIALFKDSAFYANVISKHRLFITLISVGGSVGLVNDDTITIGGVVYTGKAAETVASGFFQIVTAGTAAQNIDATAKSLVKVINQYASNTTIYAYYLTGYNDLPGQILIEERGIGSSAFVSISSRGGAFSPTIPASGSTYSSSNETKPNGIYVSKAQQPEAVPIKNLIYAGSAQYDILRIIALRDSVFILKDDGIYRITGETFADFRVSLFDPTTIIKAEETAVQFNNQVVCFSTQGVVAISDSGVQIISRPIEQDLLEISSSQYVNFDTASWGFSYESDRKYGLATVTETGDTYATQIFVYNSLTNTWTRWIKSVSCGIVSTRDNKLYLGSADPAIAYVLQERKNFDLTDNAEREVSVNINSFTGTTVEVSSTVGLEEDWTIAQFIGTTPVRQSVIESIVDATHITVRDTENWTIAAATCYEPIDVSASWAPIHGGNPAITKHFQRQVAIFQNATFDTFTLSYTSDLSIAEEEVDLIPLGGAGHGLYPWGRIAWGGQNQGLQTSTTYIPREKAICHWLNMTVSINQALKKFALCGISVFYEDISPRTK